MEPIFTDEITVNVYRRDGSEVDIVNAARVSTDTNAVTDMSGRDTGLIRALVREGHGTPLEYPGYIFEIHAPIFVSRQIVKYRLTTINEVSGRYTQLEPRFYLPSPEVRKFFQTGKTMDYQFRDIQGNKESNDVIYFLRNLQRVNINWWSSYEAAVNAGISNEVARMGMPVNIYSRLYVKMNLRSTLHFIAQRIDNPAAERPSHGQYEIGLVAQAMSEHVAADFPTVWAAFNETKWRKI